MAVIESAINKVSSDYKENLDQMQAQSNELAARLELTAQGGHWLARQRHVQRGKLIARERIGALLDRGSFFMELSPLAGEGLYESSLPAAGLITGIGIIHGKAVMLIVNDATVKGGSYYPITVKKHLRAQQIAAENKLPCIHLVDSGGAFLPLQDQVFADVDGFGRIFYNQARLSASGITQIAVVMGPCVAGGAYVAAMSEQTIMVKNQGSIYLAGPELVLAATGEKVDVESLGGADVHCRLSGVADYLADNDSEALQFCRHLVADQPVEAQQNNTTYEPPLYDARELYGLIPKDMRQPMDVYAIIAHLVDASQFEEFKALYGTTLVCGFAHIHGYPVGIVANNGVLFSESARKGTHFISLCNQRGIALVFLQNIAGFMVGKKYEQHGIASDGAKMVTAVATSRVAKFTVIIGGSFGAGNYAMCGRAYGARQLWMWPNAKISVMGADVAASLMAQIKQQSQKSADNWDEKKSAALKQKISQQFERQGSPYYSSARLWDDGVIDPLKTRRYLGQGLAIAQAKPLDDEWLRPLYRM
ncbi:MAG: methylcrotonoyl-CoA carboxylase [Gammaproteobacteria bacterium]|nr:methylcrotonoyl-CoA carboxylase [Gammaproteobacteria bacterium]